MRVLGLGWIVATLVMAAFVALQAASHAVFATPARRAKLFVGPILWTRRIGALEFSIGAIPLPAAWVDARGSDDEDDPVLELSRLRRAALVLTPWVVLGVAAVTLCGTDGLDVFARGFVQPFVGARWPSSEGVGVLRRTVEWADRAPLSGFAPRMVTKLVAFNLLPLPGTAGSVALWTLLTGSRPPRWSEAAGALVLLALLVGWSVAAYCFVF